MTPAGWRVLGLAVALLAIGAIGRLAIPLAIGGGFIAALALGLGWSRLSFRSLTLERISRDRTPSVGDTVSERVCVTNRGWLPAAVAIDGYSTVPGYQPAVSLVVAPRRSVTHTFTFVGTARGEFFLGPTRIRAFDVFGLCQSSRLDRSSQRLVVLPVVEPAGQVTLNRANGEQGTARGAQDVAPDLEAIRDYQAGDHVRRVHWPSTARLNRLVVRELERTGRPRVLVIADLAASVQVGTGAHGTEERVVGAAASIVVALLEAHRTLELIVTANRHLDIPFGRGDRLIKATLEALALARSGPSLPLESVLRAEIGRLDRDTTLVVITPSVERGWATALAQAETRGVSALVLLVEPATYGRGSSSLDVVGDLLAIGTAVALVKRDQTLSEAMSGA